MRVCLVIGGNEVSYGSKSKQPGGLRGEMEAEVKEPCRLEPCAFSGTGALRQIIRRLFRLAAVTFI